jgi:hypothetical protein
MRPEWNAGVCVHDNYITEIDVRRCLDCGETEEIEEADPTPDDEREWRHLL